MPEIDLSDLSYSGMPIEATVENGTVRVYCSGYMEWAGHEPPTDLAALVREGFEEAGEPMDADDERDLVVWDEVERRIAEAWDAAEREAQRG